MITKEKMCELHDLAASIDPQWCAVNMFVCFGFLQEASIRIFGWLSDCPSVCYTDVENDSDDIFDPGLVKAEDKLRELAEKYPARRNPQGTEKGEVI